MSDHLGRVVRTTCHRVQRFRFDRILLLEEIDHHQNGRQGVVEVVRNASGQRADRLESLSAARLPLELPLFGVEPLAVGDVLGRADGARGMPRGAFALEEGLRAGGHPTLGAVAPDDPVFQIEQAVLLSVRALQRDRDPAAIF